MTVQTLAFGGAENREMRSREFDVFLADFDCREALS
jgi:hypothetical protein